MTTSELRQAYLQFFVSRGHAVIPSASLVPENDPTTLFTSSGMQPLVPYLLGQPHPAGKRLVNAQKSFRSQDIEEVGDNRHTTFFEMLGNWSLGEYFKKEQLAWVFSFVTEVVGLDPKKLFVTVFAGNDQVPRDDESVAIWKEVFSKVGIDAQDVDHAEETGMRGGRIFYYPEKKNWWSRSGVPSAMPVGEPGGPDSELFYDFGEALGLHEQSPWSHAPCHVNCDCGRFMEIGNSVFMQYQKQADGSFRELPQRNVDFGGGLERLLAAQNGLPDVFLTDVFARILAAIQLAAGKSYGPDTQREMRVIADHIRAAVLLIGDGVLPSNKEQGYVVRRLIRRAVRFGKLLALNKPFLREVGQAVLQTYEGVYFTDASSEQTILDAVALEEQKFLTTLSKGLKELEKIPVLDGKTAFTLYETFGFPFELTEEIARERGQHVEFGAFKTEFDRHREQSRSASKGMFKGGLADHSEQVTKYHTATHLLHAALRKILGEAVSQQGSNITAERLRFDFSFPRAMSADEIRQVEEVLNAQISSKLPVHHEIMAKDKALAEGAMAFFREKYGDEVSVYTIGENPRSGWFSKELCGGPHVENIAVIGPLKIVKEEAIGSGKRRVYVRAL